jgi:membrane-associated protease RseP (regulator of RpoE activity)
MADLQPSGTHLTSISDPEFPQQEQPRLSRPPRRPYWLHILLFLLTVLTTLVVGAKLQLDFLYGEPMFIADDNFFPLRWVLQQPSRLLLGIPFSVSLLGILMAHEMGHFILSVRNRVYATLPFFIPAPTPIGTFGAFIQIKSAFHTRVALFDIGVAGPIAGFVVAVPLTVLGLALSTSLPPGADVASAQIGHPLIFQALGWVLAHLHSGRAASVPLSLTQFHPVAYAAWIGMLATSLNLLPGGQLDGGHLIYALKPRAHRIVTSLAMYALIPMAFFCWTGWLIWVFGLLITRNHPPVAAYPPLPKNRKPLAWIALAIFILTLVPTPFPGGSIYEIIQLIYFS